MRAIASQLDRISATLNVVALFLATGAVVVMVGAASWQVVARYILFQPPIWTEELARFSMVWAGILGASCAYRAKLDPSLFPQMRELPGLRGKVLTIVASAGVLAFALPVVWYSVFGLNGQMAGGYIARQFAKQADTLPISMAAFAIVIPVGFFLIMLHTFAGLAMRLTQRDAG